MIKINFEEAKNINLADSILEHGLIHITCNKKLSLDEFKSLTVKLGKPLISKTHTLDDERTVQYVSDKGLFLKDDMGWHNDWSYGEGNYYGTILYNNKNGHLSTTDFVDTLKAYESYPDKEELESLEGEYFPPQYLHDNCFTPRILKLLEKAKVVRKFAHTHHVTGDKVLYFSPATLQSDIDITHILKHCEKDIYVHNWEDNDILVYDNLRMMHRRHAFEGERELWRTQFWI